MRLINFKNYNKSKISLEFLNKKYFYVLISSGLVLSEIIMARKDNVVRYIPT